MRRRPPRATRTDTLFPYTTRFRSGLILGVLLVMAGVVGGGLAIGLLLLLPVVGVQLPTSWLDRKVEERTSAIRRDLPDTLDLRSEEHTSELQSLMRISYAVFCLKKKKNLL